MRELLEPKKMTSKHRLTAGALEAIMSGRPCDRPTIQVLGHKKIVGAQGPERYRLLLSDGEVSLSSAMLATQLNDKVTSGQVDTNAIIRLDKYICNTIQPDKKVMVLLEVTVLASAAEAGNKIGNPQPFRGTNASDQNASSATNQEPARQSGRTNPTSFAPRINPAATAQPSSAASPVQRPSTAAAAGFSGDTPSKVYPIASLTPYQNRWTIRARVTQKSAIRSWSNSKGEGTLFDMILLDESGEIRATAFKAEVDKFYNLLELNKVYYIRRATLKAANKKFSTTNNDYDMTFNGETEVIPCEDTRDLPMVSFNFIAVSELEQHQPGTTIDVIGVVKDIDDIKMIITKSTNKELKKRDVVLVDDKGVQVRLTLWGNDAETFDGTGHPILAVKNCRLSDWGGRSLSSVNSTQIVLNPDIPECHHLRGWFDSVGASMDYVEYKRDGGVGAGAAGGATNWKTLGEVKAQNLGQDKAEFFTAKATILNFKKDNCMYQACPQPDCNKKVVDQGNGNYRCEKCQKEYPDYKWRMILSINIADFSENLWISCFQDSAESLLGYKGEEIGQMKESDTTAFDQMFAAANFKSYMFRLRSKMETFNDESRMKTVCMNATPLNCTEYNRKLISDIEALLGPA